MMNNFISLAKHKSEESRKIIDELNKWAANCAKSQGEIAAFAAVIVLKDGSVETYHQSSTAINGLTLVGGIDTLKAYIIRKYHNHNEISPEAN